jgi:cell wall-active antibiotic response 4TMS protein YvqF
MRVHRRFLYWGIFLVAIGGVLVAADLGAADQAALTEVLRLWPLAVVAIGLGIVLRRTELGLPGLVLAAAVPGVVLGGAFAMAPRFAGDCATRGDLASAATTQGTFDGPATVTVKSGCGSLNAKTAPGTGWQLSAGNSVGRTPKVEASARTLSIEAKSNDSRSLLDAGRDAWDLTLPTSDLDSLSLVVTAGNGQIDLPGARIQRLALSVNAAKVVVDASAASVTDVSAVVNVGSLSIRLPTSDLAGSLRVGAGELRICTPPGLGLRFTSRGVADRVRVNGLQQHGSEWESPDYASAAHRADLSLSVNFGAVEINPLGGCK